jgi:hypothetical protein
MSLKLLGAFSALFVLAGCPGGDKDDSGCDSGCEPDTDTDTDTDTDVDTSFTTAWNAAGVTLSISGGSGTYSFGMAEQSANGWYGEDCVPGAGPNSGDFDICHDSVSASGISLTTVSKPADVVANVSTLFNVTIAEAGHLAYMLGDNATGDCWEQNDADNYYSCL